MKNLLVIIVMAANGTPVITVHSMDDDVACMLASVQIMEQMEKLSGEAIGETFNVGCVDEKLESLKEEPEE